MPEKNATTALPAPPAPVPITALDAIYVIASAERGDQFVVYAPDERGLYTVAHTSGGLGGYAAPRIHLVHPDDIPEYAARAVARMHGADTGDTVTVWLDATTGPLRASLS